MPARRAGVARAAGYGLLEVLVTLGISLTALSALVKFQGELFRGDAQARARSQAVLLAEQRLEALHAALAAAGPEAEGSGADAWSAGLAPVDDGAAARYTRAWSVAADEATATARIEVIVGWSDPAGLVHELRLASLVDPVPPGYGAARLTAPEFIRLE